jgi:hypothetical protein
VGDQPLIYRAIAKSRGAGQPRRVFRDATDWALAIPPVHLPPTTRPSTFDSRAHSFSTIRCASLTDTCFRAPNHCDHRSFSLSVPRLSSSKNKRQRHRHCRIQLQYHRSPNPFPDQNTSTSAQPGPNENSLRQVSRSSEHGLTTTALPHMRTLLPSPTTHHASPCGCQEI